MKQNEELPPVLQAVLILIFAILMIWFLAGQKIATWWAGNWWWIVVLIALIIFGVVYLWIKVISPSNREANENYEKKVKIEKDIIKKKLLKESPEEFEGLSKEEKDYLLDKRAEEEYEKELVPYMFNQNKQSKPSVEVVQPLNSALKGKLIHAVGDKCENPRCYHKRHLEVHHIIPREWGIEKGGTNKLSNLVVLCRECHADAQKGAYSKQQIKSWVSDRKSIKF